MISETELLARLILLWVDSSSMAATRCQTYRSKVLRPCKFTKRLLKNYPPRQFPPRLQTLGAANGELQIVSYPDGKQLHSSTENNSMWPARVCVCVCKRACFTANNSLHFFSFESVDEKGNQRCVTLFQTSKNRCTHAHLCILLQHARFI